LITRLLIALNVLAFLWEIAVTGSAAFTGLTANSPVLNYVLVPVAVRQYHQYYRIFTAAFLHDGIWHIGLNMLSLYWLGRFIEVVLRPWRTLFVYLVSLIASGISVVLFSAPDLPTLGASGAIFGLFGALFAIGLKLHERGRGLVRANLGILVLNLVWSFAMPFISWQAHVGGLIAGFLCGWLVFWPTRPVLTRVYDPQTGAEYASHVEQPGDDRY
jgi:membrane associated rhomboid family serine protease